MVGRSARRRERFQVRAKGTTRTPSAFRTARSSFRSRSGRSNSLGDRRSRTAPELEPTRFVDQAKALSNVGRRPRDGIGALGDLAAAQHAARDAGDRRARREGVGSSTHASSVSVCNSNAMTCRPSSERISRSRSSPPSAGATQPKPSTSRCDARRHARRPGAKRRWR